MSVAGKSECEEGRKTETSVAEKVTEASRKMNVAGESISEAHKCPPQ